MPELTSTTLRVLIERIREAARGGGDATNVRRLYGIAQELERMHSDVLALEAELKRLRDRNRKMHREKAAWIRWVGLAAKQVELPEDTEYTE